MSESLVLENPFVDIEAKLQAGRDLARFIAEGASYNGPFRGELDRDGVWSAELFDEVSDEKAAWLRQLVSLEALVGPELGSADSVNVVQYFRAGIVRKQGGEVEFIDVAVKPHTPNSLTPDPRNEYHATLKAHKRGLNVFMPLAIIKHGDNTFLMTEYIPYTSTLDNYDLTIHPYDLRYETEMVPVLKHMTDTMAETVSKGIISNDWRPKNFPITDTGETIVSDLEFAEVAESEEEHMLMLTGPGGAVTLASVWHDFYTNWDSLTNSQHEGHNNYFLQGVEIDLYMKVLSDYIDMYVDALRCHLTNDLWDVFDSKAFKETLLEDFYEERTSLDQELAL